ncbi:thioesterase family protein [Luedemannella helvata]|uniref:Hotdog domain-containing protein n=1 Tax=Luedemannella helvata TaxID=349315 RepID=A0ABN2K546_9ACTN
MTGHTRTVTVHFDDLDAMGIVHNARYALMLERAITAFWAERGHSITASGPTSTDVINAVREFSITYHRPIRGTGDVNLRFWLEKLGETSAVVGFEFTSPDGDELYADGRRVNVKLDPRTLRPAAWSEEARGIAAGLLRTPEKISH